MKSQLLQIPTTLSSFKSMTQGVIRLVFDTQENISQDTKTKIIANHEKFGWLTFLVGEEKIKIEDVSNLPSLPKLEKNEKSPSQRLRAVLYLYWKQQGNREAFFEDYYNRYYEKIINSIKERLN